MIGSLTLERLFLIIEFYNLIMTDNFIAYYWIGIMRYMIPLYDLSMKPNFTIRLT